MIGLGSPYMDVNNSTPKSFFITIREKSRFYLEMDTEIQTKEDVYEKHPNSRIYY
jgi:hypothetical protein